MITLCMDTYFWYVAISLCNKMNFGEFLQIQPQLKLLMTVISDFSWWYDFSDFRQGVQDFTECWTPGM